MYMYLYHERLTIKSGVRSFLHNPINLKASDLKMLRATLICLLAFVVGAPAKDIYVSQNGSGTTNSLAWLNAPSNWGAGTNQVGPGDTVHFVGTLTNLFTAQGSGEPANPITFHFEPGAQFSAATLSNYSIWINLDSRHDLILDGGTIQLTDNGTVATNGGTHIYNNSGIVGIRGSGINNVTVQNLVISNLFDRQAIDEPMRPGGDGSGMYFYGSQITVSNCLITGCQESITLVYDTVPTTNFTVTATTISNYNHAITVGSGGVTNPTFLNLTLTHNTLLSGDMFESPDGLELGLHRNAIFLFNESGVADSNARHSSGYISNILIACNYIKHGTSPKSHTAGTSGMFFCTYNNEATVHVRVYNNVSVLAAPLNWPGMFATASGTDVLFANNTIIGWQANGTWGGGYAWATCGTNVFAYNNLSLSSKGCWFSTTTLGFTNDNSTISNLYSGVWYDFNVYNNVSGGAGWVDLIYKYDVGGVLIQRLYDTLSTFQNMYGGMLRAHADPHSTTSMATLDANYVPLSTDTVARGHGTNLSAFFTKDFYGNPRPTNGNWTIGAFEAVAPPRVSLNVTPPTITNGQSATLTWSSAYATSVVITGLGSVPLNGSTNVAPAQTTRYTATAFGPLGTHSATVLLEILPSAPANLHIVPHNN